MAETELDRAEKRYTQAKARLQALRNREATRKRKQDTRRKVILGGALIDLAARDEDAAAMLDRLIRNLARDQDRKAFEDWDRPGGNGTQGKTGEARQAVENAPGVSQEVDLDAIRERLSQVGKIRRPAAVDNS